MDVSLTSIIHITQVNHPHLLPMAKDSVKVNVILTQKQFELLKAYAEQEETTMSEIIRGLVKSLKLKKQSLD